MLAGAILLVTAILGITGRLARWIPAPIVHGLIAGAVMPFVVDIFSALSTSDGAGRVPIMVGSAVLAYLLGQRVLGRGCRRSCRRSSPGASPRPDGTARGVPLGLLAPRGRRRPSGVLAGGDRHRHPGAPRADDGPVERPSVIYLRGQGYRPPERIINVVSGGGTLLGRCSARSRSRWRCHRSCVTAGPAAGDRSLRYRSIYLPVAAGC